MNWIFSDPHGCADKLEDLLNKINREDSNPKIYCGGDLCDRGTNTKRVIDIIIKEKINCIRGNHDDCFQSVLNKTNLVNDGQISTPISTLRWFANYGMNRAFLSYGSNINKIDKCINEGDLDTLIALVPQEHIDFLTNLPLCIEEKDFFIVHAYLNISKSVDYVQYSRDKSLWGRFNKTEILLDKEWGKFGYFGHTPTWHYNTDSVVFGPDIALIDTGASMGGKLTAICHETKQLITSY